MMDNSEILVITIIITHCTHRKIMHQMIKFIIINLKNRKILLIMTYKLRKINI
jgi:hypothetical protein